MNLFALLVFGFLTPPLVVEAKWRRHSCGAGNTGVFIRPFVQCGAGFGARLAEQLDKTADVLMVAASAGPFQLAGRGAGPSSAEIPGRARNCVRRARDVSNI